MSNKRELCLLSDYEVHELVRVLVVDLGRQPFACEEELKSLPDSLSATLEKDPSLSGFDRAKRQNDLTCPAHSKINETLLFKLDYGLCREANHPAPIITSTYHVQILLMLQSVFNKEMTEFHRRSFYPIEPYSRCPGCRSRRILSDKLFLGTLIVSTNLRPSRLTGIVEAAWRRLGYRIMDLETIEVETYLLDHRMEASSLCTEYRVFERRPDVIARPWCVLPPLALVLVY
ncbi:hypothetical protein FN846DRAFT_885663 [Sphaerosporella brunnea]|uniref:Uncharacterized protein n=1 Tax=Sphaerosporella brunnea TaxID=1250544 RepID=A0A5J5FBZ3_9PEZI|nr:hypothetical protein FN846DRAFT_885663 [Sphaerosporella brunnea]